MPRTTEQHIFKVTMVSGQEHTVQAAIHEHDGDVVKFWSTAVTAAGSGRLLGRGDLVASFNAKDVSAVVRQQISDV